MDLAQEKLIEIRNKLKVFEEKRGESIEIIAATKTRTLSEIVALRETGIPFVAGENRVQELLEKYNDVLTWDFIGRLQSNKVRNIIDKVRIIHSLDRISLLEEIDRQAKRIQKCQRCLIEVNLGREEEKGGVFIEEVPSFLERTKDFGNVKVVGLMGVAPLYFDEQSLRSVFCEANSLYLDLKNKENFEYLSMGMSNDYLLAVEQGANMVRIGRGIFGERNS